MSKKIDKKWVILILLLAFVFSLYGNMIFLSGLILVCYYLFSRKVCKKDRGFISKLFIYGFTARILLLILLSNVSVFRGAEGWINWDSWAVQKYAWQYVQFFNGNDYLIEPSKITGDFVVDSFTPNINKNFEGYGIHAGVKFLIPFVYYFGVSKYLLRIIYIFLSLFSGILIYYIIKRVADEKVAKIGALLLTFQPSLIFWSITYLKDTLAIFLITLFIYLSQRITMDKRYRYLPLLFGICFFLKFFFKSPLDNVVFIVGILSTLFLLLSRRGIYFVLFVSLMLVYVKYDYISLKMYDAFISSVHLKTSFLVAGGITYNNFPDKIVANYGDFSKLAFNGGLERLSYILSSIFHYFFEPLPLKWTKSISMAAFVPQLFYWWILTPFAILGMLNTFRKDYFRGTFVIFVIFVVLLLPYALSSANIGTIVRHRDMLSPMIIIFFSIGLRPFLNFKSHDNESFESVS